MLIVSNALLMSSATVMVRSGSLFWLKTVAMVLFMLCSTVLVEWFEAVLCGDMWDIVCDVWWLCLLQCFSITERSEMGMFYVIYVFYFRSYVFWK